MKKYQVDRELLNDIEHDTKKIEKKYRSKKKTRRQKKAEQEDLSQRWLAPILLIITLIIGYLLYLIY